jgi:hypothetical protein
MPTGHIFCSECGVSNEPDATFCENCGKRFRSVAARRAATDVEQHYAAGAPARKSRAVVVIPLVLLLGAGAAWAGVALKSKKEADSLQLAPVAQNLTLSDQPLAGGSSAPSQIVPPVAAAPQKAATAPQPRPQSVRQMWTPPPATTASTEFPTSVAPATPSSTITADNSPAAGSAVAYAPPDATTPAEATPALSSPRIAAGTAIQLKSLDKVCTDKNKESELFRTAVDQPVQGSNGAVIPKGAVVTFIIDRLNRNGGKVEFSVSPLSAELNGQQTPIIAGVDAIALKKANKGLLGALVGAAAGMATAKAAGGDTKSTMLGGAVGGAAGALIGKQLENSDGCLEKNAPIKITLRSDLSPP